MICLQGVTSQDLNRCLDYMYHGEVQIHQEDLDRFLNVAMRFQIKGLQSYGSNRGEIPTDNPFEVEIPIVKEGPMQTNEIQIANVDRAEQKVKVSQNRIAIRVHNIIDLNAETEKHIEKLDNGSVICSVCGKTMTGLNRLANMKQHIETHIEGLSYPCENCGKSFRSTSSIRKHKNTICKI